MISEFEHPKKLVFHLYIPKDKLPEIYKYHFACIKYFANVFDEFVIVLSIDNINDNDTIMKYKQMFLPWCKNITFKVIENKEFREVQTFKTEILDKVEYDNSFVFFAHSKGTSNDFNDSLVMWVCAMYYFCLKNVAKMNEMFTSRAPCSSIFFGALAYYSENVLASVKYHWHYPGSFYWVNMPALANNKNRNNFPKIEGRCYVENFPGNVVPLKYVDKGILECSYAGDYYVEGPYAYDLYRQCESVLKYCYSNETIEELKTFISYIKNNLEEV